MKNIILRGELFIKKNEEELETSVETTIGKLDILFREAVKFAIEKSKVNVDMLQVKFQVGYSRAAKLIDQMEEKGFISETGTRFRKTLITPEQFRDYFGEE